MSNTQATKWKDLSSDENDEEAKGEVPQQEQRQIQQQPRQHRERNEGGFQRGGQQYNNNRQKPNIQNRSEIEKLIDDCQDEQIILNIVKCNFEATTDDVKNTFVNFDFVALEGYNPGSFSLTFKNKEQAKEFLYTTKETKLKERNFWIKFPIHHQKSSKIPENNNKELPLNERQNKKFQDYPKKNRNDYNRKSQDLNEEETTHVGFFRSDNKPIAQQITEGRPEQQQQQERQPYPKKQYDKQSRYNKPQGSAQKQEDDEWQTVMPNFSKPTQNRNQNQNKNQKRGY